MLVKHPLSVLCKVWTVGGCLDSKEREKFSDLIRCLMAGKALPEDWNLTQPSELKAAKVPIPEKHTVSPAPAAQRPCLTVLKAGCCAGGAWK